MRLPIPFPGHQQTIPHRTDERIEIRIGENEFIVTANGFGLLGAFAIVFDDPARPEHVVAEIESPRPNPARMSCA